MIATIAAIATNLTTILILAVFPWALALPVTQWAPKMQRKKDKRTYRKITAVAALILTAGSIPPFGPWSYLLAIAAAVYLDVYWYRFAHSERGWWQLNSARWWVADDDHQEQLKRQRDAYDAGAR